MAEENVQTKTLQFNVSSSGLLKKLQSIGGVLSSNNSLPILDNFLFTIKGDGITIAGSDLETTMTAQVEAEAKEEGQVAIPAKLLLDTLKTFPEQPLTFNINMETFAVEISSEQGRYKLTGHNPEEFPKMPELEATSRVEVSAEVLSKAMELTIFATANDEMRPVMSGVYCEMSPEQMNFVATDGHKLVKYTRKDAKAESETSINLPRKALELLKQVLSGRDDTVSVEFNDSNAHFSFGEFTLVCRLIEGNYPNYRAVIPDENPNRLVIEKQSLLNSLRRVSIFSNKTTHQVKFKLTGTELQISAEDLDFANEANERLTCQYEGEDMEIGFNAQFLIGMLNNLPSKEVRMEMSAPNRAGLIYPNDKEDEQEDILMLVMPVMLNE